MQHYPNQIEGKPGDRNRCSYKFTHDSYEQASIKDAKKKYL